VRSAAVGRYRAPVTLPAGLDLDTVCFLERHESRAHALPGRSLRDLGDAVLLHDPIDREPFWNRANAIRWPAAADAFDRRLDSLMTLCATLDRLPHIWPRAVQTEPGDLVERLAANGFINVGAGHVMVLADPGPTAAFAARALPAGVTIERHHRLDRDDRTEPAMAIGLVSAEAFDVPDRHESIELETESLFDHPEVHAIVIRVDGEPAAVAKRLTFDGATYLSSIGSRPAFRGRGLGRLVTAIATADALRDGSRWIHLGVYAENEPAIALYRSLGFVTLGPAPDMLLK
jgi:ribosomal protein S18 acetylase RimI-like enzyme